MAKRALVFASLVLAVGVAAVSAAYGAGVTTPGSNFSAVDRDVVEVKGKFCPIIIDCIKGKIESAITARTDTAAFASACRATPIERVTLLEERHPHPPAGRRCATTRARLCARPCQSASHSRGNRIVTLAAPMRRS